MLPKKNRADKKSLQKIFKESRAINTHSLNFRFVLIKENHTPPRISFIVSKNTAKKATKRNFLRRVGYAALKNNLNNFPKGLIGAAIFKKSEENTETLQKEIKNILLKINESNNK
ncbi:MAG: ribonuclease P protein component [Minisyncoccia bacterium]